MEFENAKYWLWMTYVENMWRGKAQRVLELYGSPEELYKANEILLQKSGIFTEEDIYNIMAAHKTIDIEGIWDELKKKNIRFTYLGHEEYPQQLMPYADKPLWLYYRGSLPGNDEKLVGIVGARNCSIYGKTMAENAAEQLGNYNISIISGMARGIDAASHRGALKAGGKTYAVLGCGVDVCYPRENIELYMQIQEHGGVMSEYVPGAEPLKWKFPERNRIISMFADAVVIVEAKQNSGSLITTDYALQYGKEIFAVPGRVGDALSAGCNELIKSGAALLTEGADVLYATGMSLPDEKDAKKIKSNIILEKENEVVYSCLCLLPQSVDAIVEKTGMTSREVFGSLMKMMVAGIVIEPVKNHYAKVR